MRGGVFTLGPYSLSQTILIAATTRYEDSDDLEAGVSEEEDEEEEDDGSEVEDEDPVEGMRA